MTPEQTAALQALAGREFTAGEMAALGRLTVDRNDVLIERILSAGRTKRGMVMRPRFVTWAARTGMRAVIEDHSANQQSPLRSIALGLRDVVTGAADGIDFAWGENVTMLSLWIAAGYLTQTAADELLAIAEHPDPVGVPAVSLALNNLAGLITL